jgi:hypothetical protein
MNGHNDLPTLCLEPNFQSKPDARIQSTSFTHLHVSYALEPDADKGMLDLLPPETSDSVGAIYFLPDVFAPARHDVYPILCPFFIMTIRTNARIAQACRDVEFLESDLRSRGLL